MKRRHLVELHELPICPNEVRDTLTDILQLSIRINRIYSPAARLLGAALRKTGSRRVVDLCSGAGGPWRELQPQIASQARGSVSICLTDKFPNEAASQTMTRQSGLRYESQSVDAAAVPEELDGFRTLFTSFHHFRPERARRIIGDAVRNRQGVAIFEFTRRDWSSVLRMLLGPLAALLAVPFLKPFRWSRLFWTYVIPLVPLALTLDGIVSCLRTYTTAELKAMVAEFPEYEWQIGEERGEHWAIPVTYLISYPRVSSEVEEQVVEVDQPALAIAE